MFVNIQRCYSVSFVYNILLISLFLSLSSLSVFIPVCFKSTQHCPTTTQSPPPQPITTHHNPCYSNHKNKGKSNPKSNLQWKTRQLRTQNQTFNKNTHQPKLKIKPRPKLKPRSSPLPWSACYYHERGEKQVLESYSKGKDQKKKNEDKRPWERK